MERREFLKLAGGATSILAIDRVPGIETIAAPYPPYPEIRSGILDASGWSETTKREKEHSSSLWRFTEYTWDSLQDQITEATGGKVDMPLGGLLAIRIGNDSTTFKINGNEILDGETFFSTQAAMWSRKREIESEIATYFSEFFDEVLAKQSRIDWGIVNLASVEVNAITSICRDADGSMTTETGQSVSAVEYEFEYPLREDTVNDTSEPALARETTLTMTGWQIRWRHNGQLYAAAALHPKAVEETCGLGDPHVEQALSTAIGDNVDLGIDQPYYGEIFTMMEAVQ